MLSRMSTFVLTPKGPFSLSLASDVVARFPPLRHQPKAARAVRIGFVLDRDHCSVAASLREVNGAIHCVATGTKKLDVVKNQVARIFSLDHDATDYPQVALRDSRIARLMDALPGLRPVCFTSPYESACWAIISQRITTTQASKIVAELVRAHGEKVLLEGEEIGVFPRPDRLLDVSSIRALPTLKVDRLHGIATAALEGKLDAEHLRSLGAERAPQALRFLPGIGPFWANGIYLRACGITDVFPDEPLCLAALGSLHGLGDSPTRAQLAPILERYRPFRMWIAFLLRVAAARGILDGVSGREGSLREAHRRARGPRLGLRSALPKPRARREDETQA